MIEDHLRQIEDRLLHSPDLTDDQRAKLAATLAELRSEIAALAETHSEKALHIARAAGASGTLSEAAAGLETSHPGLVAAVNRLAIILSNSGI